MVSWVRKNILYLAWFQALIATFGSLYASEVAGLPPCSLCWYQRVFMYPLVFILAVGILKKDNNLPFFVLPLAVLGAMTAFYQYLLQMKVISTTSAPCAIDVSCTQIDWIAFNFITLPLLSFLGFAFIIFAVLIFQKFGKKQ